MATEVSDGEAEVEIVGVEVEFRSRKGEVRFPVEPFSTSMPWWARFSLSTHGISPWDEPPLIFADTVRGREQEWEDQVAVPLRRFCGKLTTTAEQGTEFLGLYIMAPSWVALFLIYLLVTIQILVMPQWADSGCVKILYGMSYAALALVLSSTAVLIIAAGVSFDNKRTNLDVVKEVNEFFSQSLRCSGLLRDISPSIRMLKNRATDLIQIVVYINQHCELVREHISEGGGVGRRHWEQTPIQSRPSPADAPDVVIPIDGE